MGGAGSAVMEACYHWQAANETGRVIVVCNDTDEAHNGSNARSILLLILFVF